MIEEKIIVSPIVCSYFNDDVTKIRIEVPLPGVKKGDISLKLNEESLFLIAPRDDVRYVTAMAIFCPIVPGKAEAKYENGLLRITAPFKDTMDSPLKIDVL